MQESDPKIAGDIQRVREIPFLPVLLEVVCTATGMGFAAVARVTERRWVAGAVEDRIRFGLGVGGELPVETTLCHQIRQTQTPVVIDHVAFDAIYCDHQTPAKYGFESYISFPIMLRDGAFFGTLCAIDPAARPLKRPAILGLFKTLANLIAQYLNGMDSLPESDRSRLAMYAEMELKALRNDYSADEAGGNADLMLKTRRLELKIDQLLMAIDPDSSFMKYDN